MRVGLSSNNKQEILTNENSINFCDYCCCATDVEVCIDPLEDDESNICSECHSELCEHQ